MNGTESNDNDCGIGKVVDMSSFRYKDTLILEFLQPEFGVETLTII